MTQDTVNVRDPVEGVTLDVPDHPANGPTAMRIKQLHERAQRADDGDGYTPDDPHDHPEKYSYGMGDELPVLIRSNMRAAPVEGVQGSYTEIIESECEVCGYDRADHSVHTLAGMHRVECRACGNVTEET